MDWIILEKHLEFNNVSQKRIGTRAKQNVNMETRLTKKEKTLMLCIFILKYILHTVSQ